MNNSKILIGQPSIYPDKLIDDLKLLFLKLPKVQSAYLAQVFVPNVDTIAHPVIGVDMDGDLSEIADEIKSVIQINISNTEYIDVVPVTTKGLAEYFAKISPFYKTNKN
jgi:hypothetical protein